MHSSKNYKDIVVITSRFPYPLEKGDKLRAYYQIRELSKHFNIHLISTTEHTVSDGDREKLSRYCKSITIHKIFSMEKWFGTALNMFSNQPFQVGYFHHHRIHRKIKKQLKHLAPDHIYCQLVRAAEYVKHYHDCPKTLDYMDALSKGVERRAEKANGIIKMIFQHEFKRLMRYENAIFEYFEHHTIISSQDRNYIFHKNREKIKVVPNGVDESFIQYQSKEKKEIDLLFTGNMSYPPNITASIYLVKEILPGLKNSLSLTLAGANPVKEVCALDGEMVDVTGYVKDLKAVYSSSKVFVAPMFLGTGLQNKLLEAMSIGVPCVTTSMANNALQAEPDKEILIANSAEEFAYQIDRLITEDKLRTEIAENGKRFIRQRYQWEQVTKELIELIGV